MVLLIGTNIGAIIQMGEAFGYAVQSQWPDSPSWLWDRSGGWHKCCRAVLLMGWGGLTAC